MTFSLCNAGQTFQRYLNRALGDLEFVFVYIDDILVAFSTRKEHGTHLRVVLQRLREFSLRLWYGYGRHTQAESFKKRSKKASPRQQTQLSFISQFYTKIDYFTGKDNVLADYLSRIESIRLATDISLMELARAQEADEELGHLLSSPQMLS